MGAATLKRISVGAAAVLFFLLTQKIFLHLSYLKSSLTPEYYLIQISLGLTGYMFSILASWFAFRLPGGLVTVGLTSLIILFICSFTASAFYLWHIVAYAFLLLFLHFLDQEYLEQIAVLAVDREKAVNEKNDLELSYKVKGEGISILFEKYSTYYNLRRLAEELATSLLVSEISKAVVEKTYHFIAKGDGAILTFLSPAENQNSFPLVVAQYAANSEIKSKKRQEGDLYDQWALKNRRRLIISDAQQDFRFDAHEVIKLKDVRSLIIAPLIHGGRAAGTLRLQSIQPDQFSNDDLRLLDTIAVLSSSALFNAQLYEKTKELAIRDSLTALFVRSHFYERFRDEHQRALMTHRPLSVLMCDLDHFKRINDKMGHAMGDMVLVHFAKILASLKDKSALAARYGGEEFVVLLPEIDKKEALQIGERIRKQTEESPITVRRDKVQVTVSMGIASMPEDSLDLEELIKFADQALYRAKRSGRNQVCISGS
ncbi:MAG: sensor domain-containing diguanylate cyclase [Candidatus Omnitrophica bacterium]|nr:sensor domain-containing diguanylate cyclase [Candidatus Omnitrophota bacterium]